MDFPKMMTVTESLDLNKLMAMHAKGAGAIQYFIERLSPPARKVVVGEIERAAQNLQAMALMISRHPAVKADGLLQAVRIACDAPGDSVAVQKALANFGCGRWGGNGNKRMKGVVLSTWITAIEVTPDGEISLINGSKEDAHSDGGQLPVISAAQAIEAFGMTDLNPRP
jgi:hypothetical protein